jgi:hypothetical protein
MCTQPAAVPARRIREDSMKRVVIAACAMALLGPASNAWAVSNTAKGAVAGAVGGAVVAGPVGAVVGGVGGAVVGSRHHRHHRPARRHHHRHPAR